MWEASCDKVNVVGGEQKEHKMKLRNNGKTLEEEETKTMLTQTQQSDVRYAYATITAAICAQGCAR